MSLLRSTAMTDLERLKAAVQAKAQAVAEAEERDAEMREEIRAAMAAKTPLKELMEVTGLSRQRLYQIRDNTR